MSVTFNADNKSKQCFTDTPVYSVKNVKSFMGREGRGFECSLYKDGKRIGTITDTAHGGMVDFYLDDGELEKLQAHCKSLPKVKWNMPELDDREPDGHHVSDESFVCNMVDKFEQLKQYKKWCKKQTVFRIDGDKEGEFRTISALFDAKVKAHLVKKYPDNGLYIVNEHLA
jgi:hypothetical protein